MARQQRWGWGASGVRVSKAVGQADAALSGKEGVCEYLTKQSMDEWVKVEAETLDRWTDRQWVGSRTDVLTCYRLEELLHRD